MAKPPTVKTTLRYELFVKHNPDNRPINEAKHRKLKSSIKKYGMLPYWPIVVHRNGNGQLHVDDGQHRLHFAMALQQPVYYVESSHDFDIADINSTQAPWTFRDYVDKYCEEGNEHYIEACEFSQQHRIPLSTAFVVLGGYSSPNPSIADRVRSGLFVVTHPDYATRFAMTYSPVAAVVKHCRKLAFQMACMACCRVPEFDPARFVRNATKHTDRLLDRGTRDACLQDIEEVYNLRHSKKIPLKFATQEILKERNASNHDQ